mmetsp:Transcript_31096/g.61320  ORF Transcript_31096/g.61320 Transcript_31096/m.61320 type:complete len:160 (+) Transcript_31096:1037-1516(+)
MSLYHGVTQERENRVLETGKKEAKQGDGMKRVKTAGFLPLPSSPFASFLMSEYRCVCVAFCRFPVYALSDGLSVCLSVSVCLLVHLTDFFSDLSATRILDRRSSSDRNKGRLVKQNEQHTASPLCLFRPLHVSFRCMAVVFFWFVCLFVCLLHARCMSS